MSLSSITPMPRILSPAISIVGYKYEHPFQRLIDDLINYENFYLFYRCCFSRFFTAFHSNKRS